MKQVKKKQNGIDDQNLSLPEQKWNEHEIKVYKTLAKFNYNE